MSVLKKNGHEIGRIDEAWWTASYRSNGWVLINHGTGWRRWGHNPVDDVEDHYRCAKEDYDADLPAYQAFRALVRKLFTMRQLGMAQCIFELYAGKTERGIPVMGDVDAFWSDIEEHFGANTILHDEARQVMLHHLDYRIARNEGLWAIVVERGGATDTPSVVEIMMGDKTQRQKRLRFNTEMYKQHGYMEPKLVARPATRKEVQFYEMIGNKIWKPGDP